MSGTIHSDEAEIVDGFVLTQHSAVDRVGCESLGLELGRAGVRERVGYFQVAEPIADEIGITSPGQNPNPRLYDCR